MKSWAESEVDDVNMFGRSAYNRFYYASYLQVRNTLSELDEKWKKTSHGNIPELLTNKVKSKVKTALDRQLKSGLITKSSHSRMLTDFTASTTGLSSLLAEAYDVRCVADYEPEVSCLKHQSSGLTLNDYKLNTAEKWPDRASGYCKTIRKVWNHAGI